MKLPFLPYFAICLSLFFCHCSRLSVAGTTSGSETTNGRIRGTVSGGFGGASGVIVEVLPSSFNPLRPEQSIAPRFDTTDATGNFLFDGVDSGSYVLVALHRKNLTRAMVSGIYVHNDTVGNAQCTLATTGAISMEPPRYADATNGYAFIPGTHIYKHFGGAGKRVVLDSVPIGKIPSVQYASTASSGATVARYDVSVTSADTNALFNASLKYARRLYLNTTATGADIVENQMHFPVLIRLTGQNFDFSQAQANGADILLTKADAGNIPFHIERWDSVSGHGELWVTVDTVFANTNNRYLTLYWGSSPDTINIFSNGATVFDTANGFQGVWHLSETLDTLHDATAHNFGGIRAGSQLPVSGEIGLGQSYTISGDYSDMGNVLNLKTSDISVSAWIKRATIADVCTVIGKSNGGNPSPTYGWLVAFTYGRLRFYTATTASTLGSGEPGTFMVTAKTEAAIADTTTWHFIAAVIGRSSNSACKLYVDGTDVTDSIFGDIATVGAAANAVALKIGAEADNDFPFKGNIDEAVVAFTVRSPDWIKLCYMNQKSEDKLITVK